jgi:hypothetical protein
MWKHKRFILIGLLAAILVVGGIIGAATVVATDDNGGESQLETVAATEDNGDQSQLETQREALLDRVVEIYEENTGVAIDREQLKAAFVQAREEMKDQALENWLEKLVDEGTITQDQADQYLEWWQDRPEDMPLPERLGHGFGGRGFHGGMERGGDPNCWGDRLMPFRNS